MNMDSRYTSYIIWTSVMLVIKYTLIILLTTSVHVCVPLPQRPTPARYLLYYSRCAEKSKQLLLSLTYCVFNYQHQGSSNRETWTAFMLAIKNTFKFFLISFYVSSLLHQDVCYMKVFVLKHWKQLFLSKLIPYLLGRSTVFLYSYSSLIYLRGTYKKSIRKKI